MKVGDVVISNPVSLFRLASGSGLYSHAICVAVNPLVLVSEAGDMMWETVHPSDVLALCQAHAGVTVRAFQRFARERHGPKAAAVAAGIQKLRSALETFASYKSRRHADPSSAYLRGLDDAFATTAEQAREVLREIGET